MIKKLAAFIVLTFLVVPFASLAQSPAGTEKSIQSLSATDIADDSIVVISQEETGVPGYVRQQVASVCFGEVQITDYYGAPLDPKDEKAVLFERQMCAQRTFADDGSDSD
jgi:hypothetical protein